MKKVIAILAKSENNVIGNKNKLPWHLKEDMVFFKQTTTNNSIIMGRKTYESLGRDSLPNRENIIVSRSDFNCPSGVLCFNTIEDAIKNASKDFVYIIGGSEIYNYCLANNLCDEILLTILHKEFDGDTYINLNLAQYRSEYIINNQISESGLRYSILRYIKFANY